MPTQILNGVGLRHSSYFIKITSKINVIKYIEHTNVNDFFLELLGGIGWDLH